jgi:hypothetical protein
MRPLSQELRTHLLRWDPIGVGGAAEGADEYDCLISPLLRQLSGGATAAAVAAWLSHELAEHFGLQPDPDRETHFGEELVGWWRESTVP